MRSICCCWSGSYYQFSFQQGINFIYIIQNSLSKTWFWRVSLWLNTWTQLKKQICEHTCPWPTMYWVMLRLVAIYFSRYKFINIFSLFILKLFISWCDETVLHEVTVPRYGSVYSWPLNTILTWRKKKQVVKKLKALGWMSKSLEEVYEDVDHCCNALSERLGNHLYFFNDRCTELDAVVFGHVFTLLTTPMPDNRLAAIVRSYPNLVEACQFTEKTYFLPKPTVNKDDSGDAY